MMNAQKIVTPAKAGVQGNGNCSTSLDSGVRRNDEREQIPIYCETVI
jgi:hypothetical protein